MSLSISSSESSPIVAGDTVASHGGSYRVAELRWAKRLCVLSPLLAVIAIPFLDHFLLGLLYLKPVESTWYVVAAFQSKPAIVLALALAAVPWLWLIGIKADSWLERSRIPWAVLFAIGALVVLGLLLGTTRARWFFVEWAKVRAPNPSFARNTLFWEQRNFEQTGFQDSRSEREATESPRKHSWPQATGKVGLIGSSQTNQGFDLELLQADCPRHSFEKNCLAGFGPMQYSFLQERFDQRGFQTIVCQLSEFDFFREEAVPVERLRFAATLRGTLRIASTLTPKQQWENRGARRPWLCLRGSSLAVTRSLSTNAVWVLVGPKFSGTERRIATRKIGSDASRQRSGAGRRNCFSQTEHRTQGIGRSQL